MSPRPDVHDLHFVRELVRREAAIAIEPDMDYLMRARLHELARSRGEPSLPGMMQRLRAGGDGELAESVVEAMTINETSFFRDDHPFESLCDDVLPRLAARHPAGALRIWCAACSTGQEPWSVAMAVRERLPELWPRIEIVATDLDRRCLARAEAGRYTRFETERGLSAARRERHFTGEGDAWSIRPELRGAVRFRRLNIASDWNGLRGVHVALVRNVLIYFGPADKRRALDRLRGVLVPGARLLLGSSETAASIDPSFRTERLGRTHWFHTDAPEGET